PQPSRQSPSRECVRAAAHESGLGPLRGYRPVLSRSGYPLSATVLVPPRLPRPFYRRGAETGSRTRTSLRTSVFETDASACSATSARPSGGSTILSAREMGPDRRFDLGFDRLRT